MKLREELSLTKDALHETTKKFEELELDHKELLEQEEGFEKLVEENDGLVIQVKDLQAEVNSLFEQKSTLEQNISSTNNENNLLKEEKESLLLKVHELENSLAKEVERKAEVKKSSELQYTITGLKDMVLSLQREEVKLCGNLVELEKKCLEGLRKEEEMEKKITKIVMVNNEKEGRIESLIEEKCLVEKELDKALKQLNDEKKKTEQMVTEKNEMAEDKVRRETEIVELQKQLVEFKDSISELEVSCNDQEEKVKMLESEVGHYKAAFNRVALEKDEILKCFADDKQNGINMKKQIQEMEHHLQGVIIKKVEEVKVDYVNMVGGKKELETQCQVLNKEIAYLKTSLGKGHKEFSAEFAWDDVGSDDDNSIMASQGKLVISGFHSSLSLSMIQFFSTLNFSPKKVLNELEIKAFIPGKFLITALYTSKGNSRDKLVNWFHVAINISIIWGKSFDLLLIDREFCDYPKGNTETPTKQGANNSGCHNFGAGSAMNLIFIDVRTVTLYNEGNMKLWDLASKYALSYSYVRKHMAFATKVSLKKAMEVVVDPQCFDILSDLSVNIKKLKAADVDRFSIMVTSRKTSERVSVISIFVVTLEVEEFWNKALVVQPVRHFANGWRLPVERKSFVLHVPVGIFTYHKYMMAMDEVLVIELNIIKSSDDGEYAKTSRKSSWSAEHGITPDFDYHLVLLVTLEYYWHLSEVEEYVSKLWAEVTTPVWEALMSCVCIHENINPVDCTKIGTLACGESTQFPFDSGGLSSLIF